MVTIPLCPKCGRRYKLHRLKKVAFFTCPQCGVFDPLGRFSGTMADALEYINRDSAENPQVSMFEGEGVDGRQVNRN